MEVSMSQADFEKFAMRIRQDAALLTRLLTGAGTPEEFVEKAVVLGREMGHEFTKEEADAWFQSQIKAKPAGELSDLQLDNVAGGMTLMITPGLIGGIQTTTGVPPPLPLGGSGLGGTPLSVPLSLAPFIGALFPVP
jgi:hypothetical protein